MSSRYTDTSRLDSDDWRRLLGSIPVALDTAASCGVDSANVFVEASRHDRYHFSQSVQNGRPQPPERRRVRRYVEGASITTYADDRLAVVCMDAAENEGAASAALSACAEVGAGGKRQGSASGQYRALDGSEMLQEYPDGIAPSAIAEGSRSLAEACLSVCPDAGQIDVVVSEDVRRILVSSTYGPPRFRRHALTTTTVTCERKRGPDIRVVSGQVGQVSPGSWNGHEMMYEVERQAGVQSSEYSEGPTRIPVVFEAGWCAGVWMHEVIGHSLEGDNILKGWGSFAQLEETVAPSTVTIVDDSTCNSLRGGMPFDDEGVAGSRNVLVSDGIVRGHIHSRLSARRSGARASGNGRRESYLSVPMARMTNLMLENGERSTREILGSISKGLLIKELGSGTVDGRTGRFSFDVIRAHRLEAGRIGEGVTGFALSGDARSALAGIRAVGNDFEADPGRGVCLKDGQAVPVSLGSPTVLIDGLEMRRRG